MISRARLTIVAALLLVSASAARATAQGGTRSGPFDLRTGRFGSAVSPDPARPADSLAVPSARAWTALGQVYEGLGIKLTVIDTEAHVVGVLRGVQRRPVGDLRLSRVLECGSGQYGPNAERYTVQLTALSQVIALTDTTVAVDTRVGGVAAQNGVNSSVGCASTGELEERIIALLKKKLGL